MLATTDNVLIYSIDSKYGQKIFLKALLKISVLLGSFSNPLRATVSSS